MAFSTPERRSTNLFNHLFAHDDVQRSIFYPDITSKIRSSIRHQVWSGEARSTASDSVQQSTRSRHCECRDGRIAHFWKALWSAAQMTKLMPNTHRRRRSDCRIESSRRRRYVLGLMWTLRKTTSNDIDIITARCCCNYCWHCHIDEFVKK